MGKNQYIAIGISLILLVTVYFFANTIKPSKPHKSMKEMADRSAFDFNAYKQQRLNSLNEDTLKLATELEKTVANAKGKQQKAEALKAIIDLLNSAGRIDIAANYAFELAENKDSINYWAYAGDLNYQSAFVPEDSMARQYFINRAMSGFSHCIEKDSSNPAFRIKLAECYMDGTSEVMSGVQLLLDVVRKDSNNADALFTLGRYGIVSGQFEKAILRLEKVVYLQPQNADAYVLLAEAYEKNGNVPKAISNLEKGLKYLDDPEMKRLIEGHIKELKNGKNI